MALEDNLTATIVRPVHVGLLDFTTDPVRGWTGPGSFLPTGTGDADLDGNTFVNVAGAVNISDFSEGRGLGEPIKISFTAGDMEDEEIFQQLVVDQREYMARKCKIWLFFLNSDESAVLADFAVLFNGIMVGAEFTRQPGQPAMITISADADLKKAHAPPVFWIDHQRYHSTDTASTYINHIGRKATAVAPPGGPSQPPTYNPYTPGRDFGY